MPWDAISASFGLLSWEVFLALVVGVAVCQVIVAIPGLGGHFVLVMLLPFVVTLDTMSAVAVLIGASVASGTGNTVTSVLFGIPGSSMGVASVIDGYPMAKKGLAGRALAAGFTASMVGGILGAIGMALVIPIVRPIVLAIGPPEFFILILASVAFIALIGTKDTLRGLIAGLLGLLLTFIGQEPTTAAMRYTFGQIYLWDGISLVPFLIGLFALSEMIRLIFDRSAISEAQASGKTPKGQRLDGFLDVFRHWKATGQSSLVGLGIGLVPGLGGETAQFAAYSWVSRTSRNRKDFGSGSVEGVIAADAATNSKEGGALIPTLMLGIPGSSGMAILLLILIAVGVQPGRALMENNLDLLYVMVWMLVVTSIVATVICLSATNLLAKVTGLRASLIVAPVLVISFFGAYVTNYHVGDVLVMLAAGFLGYGMERFGYSRNTLVIGFVLGGLLEQNFLLSYRLFGFDFLTRPITATIAVVTILGLGIPLVRALYQGVRRGRTPAAVADRAAEQLKEHADDVER